MCSNKFEMEYLNQLPERTIDKKLYELAKEYIEKTDKFDKELCGNENGLPQNSMQRRIMMQNADKIAKEISNREKIDVGILQRNNMATFINIKIETFDRTKKQFTFDKEAYINIDAISSIDDCVDSFMIEGQKSKSHIAMVNGNHYVIKETMSEFLNRIRIRKAGDIIC